MLYCTVLPSLPCDYTLIQLTSFIKIASNSFFRPSVRLVGRVNTQVELLSPLVHLAIVDRMKVNSSVRCVTPNEWSVNFTPSPRNFHSSIHTQSRHNDQFPFPSFPITCKVNTATRPSEMSYLLFVYYKYVGYKSSTTAPVNIAVKVCWSKYASKIAPA